MASMNSFRDVLSCPFCKRPIGEAEEIVSRFGDVITGGKCECGAVYVYDRSGHNMGDAYVDALNLAYDGDMDKAWSSVPGQDYEILELNYNVRKNKFGRESTSRGKISPGYLFILVREKGAD